MLEDAWDHCAAAANSLRPELRANESAIGALISQGQLSSVSKNSASQSYAFGGAGSLTTPEVARAWRDLINLFDQVESILSTAGDIVIGYEGDNDPAIYAEMRARLVPAYSGQADITNLRVLA